MAIDSTTRREPERLELSLPGMRVTLWGFTIVSILLVALPSVYLVIWAFWGTDTVGILRAGPSTDWFARVLLDREWQHALWRSTVLAIVVSGAGAMATAVHFYCIRYALRTVARATQIAAILPFVIPAVVYGLSLKLIGVRLGVPEVCLVFLGHLIFILPLQYFLVDSVQEVVKTDMLLAGTTMGAGHVTNFVFVYLPTVYTAVVHAFIVGFFYSFDELVIAAFVLGESEGTVPKKLWDQAMHCNAPHPAVIAVLLLGTYVLILLGSSLLARVDRRRLLCALRGQ